MPRSGIELLANAQYVGANNQQNLGPYVNVSFGISHKFGPGQLTLFMNNAFNTYAGVFATDAFAQPLPLSNGAAYMHGRDAVDAAHDLRIVCDGDRRPRPGSVVPAVRPARVALGPTPAPSPEPSGNPRAVRSLRRESAAAGDRPPRPLDDERHVRRRRANGGQTGVRRATRLRGRVRSWDQDAGRARSDDRRA